MVFYCFKVINIFSYSFQLFNRKYSKEKSFSSSWVNNCLISLIKEERFCNFPPTSNNCFHSSDRFFLATVCFQRLWNSFNHCFSASLTLSICEGKFHSFINKSMSSCVLLIFSSASFFVLETSTNKL